MLNTASDNLFYKILDHLFFLRPMLIIPVWTILLLGISHSSISAISSTSLIFVALSATGLSGAVFIMNQIFDIESDRLNNKVHFLPKGYISISTAWVMFIILNLVSIGLAFVLSVNVGLIAIVIMLLGILYSAPPIILKNRAWPAAFTNAIGHGTLVFLLGYCAAGGNLVAGLIGSAPYFFAVAAVYIGTTLPDIEGDRHTGKITLGVNLGIANAIYLAFSCYLLGLGVAALIGDGLFLIAAGSLFPFYIYSLFVKTVKFSTLTIKLSIIALSLGATYYYPIYLLFLALLVWLLRFYYKRRFGVHYPTIN